MFLKRLSAALVTITCLGWAALGAAPNTSTTATNNGNENSAMAPLALGVTISSVDISCYHESDGKILVEITDGVQPFQWKLYYGTSTTPINQNSSNVTSFSIPVASAGNYHLTVTDNTPSAASSNYVSVDEPKPVVVSIVALTPITCTNGTGGITITATSDFANRDFYVKKQQTAITQTNTTGVFTGLTAGDYIAWAVNTNGCSGYYTGTTVLQLVEPSDLSTVNVIPTQINCFGETGTAQLANLPDNSGIDAYRVQLQNMRTSSTSYSLVSGNTYVGLDYGNYTLTLQRTGCPAVTKSFVIDQVSDISINYSAVVPIKCFGGKTSVNVTVTGGKAGKTFIIVLDNGDADPGNDQTSPTLVYGNSHEFTNVSEGTYTLRCIDQEEPTCIKTKSVKVDAPQNPLVWDANPTGSSPKCNGGTDGLFQISVSGGTKPYKYYVDGTIASLPINRAAGTYAVYVEDDNLCTTETKQVTISQPNPLVVTYDPVNDVDVKCPNGGTGEIHLTIAGGVGGYNYDITPTVAGSIARLHVPTGSTVVIGALKAGTYDVKVRDANNCEASTITGIEIKDPDPITIADADFTLDTIQCNGETATLQVKATGGSDPNMTYKLYKENTLVNTITNSGFVTFSGLTPSSYKLRVWSDLTCTGFLKSFTVIDRKKLETVVISNSITVQCPGVNPVFTLTVDGEAPFSYSIEGSTVQDVSFTGYSVVISSGLTVSTAGSANRIIVKDKYGCEKDVFVTIYEPLPIIASNPTFTDVLCKSENSGTVKLDVTGGSPGYQLFLVNESSDTIKRGQSQTGTNATITGIPAGKYELLIRDRKGCNAPNPITDIIIDEPDSVLKIEDPVFEPIKCFGSKTVVTLTATGGWPVDKKIQVFGTGVNVKISSSKKIALGAGEYTLNASDNNGCTATRLLRIEQPPQLILAEPIVENVSCFGKKDASITFSFVGGTPGYKYGLDGLNFPADSSFTGTTYTINKGLIARADYQLVLRDANDCPSNVVPISITEPNVVDFRIRPNNRADSVSCHGLSDGNIVILDASGGNLNGYKAFLKPPVGAEYPVNFPDINGLPAGIYGVRITDLSNCTSVVKLDTISEPTQIMINNIDSTIVTCHNFSDGSITIDAEGGMPYGLQYKISRDGYEKGWVSDPEFKDLTAGDYKVWVGLRTNTEACNLQLSREVKLENPIEITVVDPVDKTDVSCHNLHDGSVNIVASGGTGMLTYTLEVVPPGVEGTNTTGKWTKVLGDDNTTSTIYSYTVKDQNSCKKTGKITILNPSELKIEELDHHQVYCNDDPSGWIIVKATGGAGKYAYKSNVTNSDTIQISHGEYSKEADSRIKMLLLTGGDYYPAVIDGNGCVASIPNAITIVNPPPLKIDRVEVGDKKCFDSEDDETIIYLDQNDCGTRGIYKYTINKWARTNDTIELQSSFINVRDTMVYPMVKDAMGCIARYDSIAIKWPDAFNVTIKKKPITCWNNQYGSLIAQFTGGVMPYYVGIDDISFASGVQIDKEVPGAVLVDTIAGNKGNGFFYYDKKNWDVYVKDATGCVALNSPNSSDMNPYYFDVYSWDAVDTFAITVVRTNAPNCNYEKASIQIEANNLGAKPYSYWADYYDYETNSFAREDSGSNTPLEVHPDKILTWHVADINSCKPLVSKEIDPQGKQQVYIPAHSDTIEVTIKINESEIPECPLTKDGVVRINIKGFAEEGVEVRIYKTDSTYANDPFNPVHTYAFGLVQSDSSYQYSKINPLTMDTVYSDALYARTNDSIKYLFSVGYYYIEFEDIKTGCMVDEKFVLDSKDTICPNNYNQVFSPNGDKKNDEWILNNLHLQNASLRIFNSEGELVYHFPKGVNGETPDGMKWDGFDDKGRPVPIGTYMYVYMIDAVEGKAEYGTITLIRGTN